VTSIVQRQAKLADGRDLIYFDDADTDLAAERRIDERRLEVRPATSTMRQDVLSGEWISVAATRQDRVFLPAAELDPLAPQRLGNPSEIPDRYDVVVFENRFPSFGPKLGVVDTSEIGFERTASSFGRCEVVSFSPESAGSLGSQTVSRVRTVVEAWAERTAALSMMEGVEQVFPFENRGEAIGVTLHHPHGQIYAYPFVTPRTRAMLDAVERIGADLFARILDRESAGPRLVIEGEYWAAYVPFAARWPIEVHLMPRRHVPDLAALDDAERDELAVLHRRLLRGIDAMYETPTPYVAAWHQAPVRVGRQGIRLHLQLTSPRRAADRLKYPAGSETAMGAWIGDVVPEAQAHRIRDALATVGELQ
jgi:UDPglucose--hexose-1-phosphate uridylyltransferase